ncbi:MULTISPECIES: hypothetical protein [unclassified Bradyrhizobium]|nr:MULTISPECIES: hypothetical protein [unclassified Bradyrhizobium]
MAIALNVGAWLRKCAARYVKAYRDLDGGRATGDDRPALKG